MANLERTIRKCKTDNVIGTSLFLSEQYDLYTIWQNIEGEPMATKDNIGLRNLKYFQTKSTIDIDSSLQLTFDVMNQLIDINCIQILPQIVKFCEICENREQFHLIKDIMNKLYETVQIENLDTHQVNNFIQFNLECFKYSVHFWYFFSLQHIIYCLCKSYAVLVPSMHDLNHLCTILSVYLKSSHLMIRLAALKGLILLFESCIKMNTTIGGLSEEILLLRTFIINYVSKYGITNER